MAERAVVRRIGAAVVSLAALGTAAGPVWAQPRMDPAHLVRAISDSESPPADYVPVTETVKGRVGDTVVVRLGVANLGPGDPRSGGVFSVVPPPGTTITSIPWEGDDDDSRYACQPPQDKDNYFFVCDLEQWGAPAPGLPVTVGFHIRIDKRIPGAMGSIIVFGSNDPVHGNDRAAIPVEAAQAPLWRRQNPLWHWHRWPLVAGALALASAGGWFVGKRRGGRPRCR